MGLRHWSSTTLFNWVHQNNLIYNTCWEDPRLDHEALQITPQDRVMVITSAGCNALDYALKGPEHVYAVDVNPAQNALLDLKLAAIRNLDYASFFAMFGLGRLPQVMELYREQLRGALPPPSQMFWDRKIGYFAGATDKASFYFHGTTGLLARTINFYIDHIVKLRGAIEDILAAPSLDHQREIYESQLRDAFWTRPLRWLLGRDLTLSLLGVPRPQRCQVEASCPGGIVGFIEECLESVFCWLPLSDNYFWRVYLCGRYTKACCPEYLKESGFARLKSGLVDRITTHTATVEDFLAGHSDPISVFVLLDHMDWMSAHGRDMLQSEWQRIVEQAAPTNRIIWRSAAQDTDFLDPLMLQIGERQRRLGDVLERDRETASRLHALDRVHTYGSFHIARLKAEALA